MEAAKKAGRPPTTLCNHFVRLWLLRRVPLNDKLTRNLVDCPLWVDNVITGAARLNNSEKDNTKPCSPGLLFKLLCELPALSTATVRSYMDRRRPAGDEYSTQRISQITKAAMSASKAIDHHLERLEQGIPMVPSLNKTVVVLKMASPIAPCELMAA